MELQHAKKKAVEQAEQMLTQKLSACKKAYEEESVVWFVKEVLRVFRVFLEKYEGDRNLVSNFVLNSSFLELHWLIEEREAGGKI